jgi:flagellar biosynthesis protein FlhG
MYKFDQAEGIRKMIHPKPIRVVAVSSGKGGVGKTNISVNLGVCLCQMGHQAVLMDADMGLANVDVLLGLQPKYNLSHLISGERSLREIIVEGPAGLKIVPGSSGIQHLAELTPAEQAGIIRSFSEISHNLDVLIVDTAAGISNGVTSFARASQEIIDRKSVV